MQLPPPKNHCYLLRKMVGFICGSECINYVVLNRALWIVNTHFYAVSAPHHAYINYNSR